MNHHELAKLCEDSYLDEPDFSKNGVDVFRALTETSVVFVIRGTQLSFLDILRNLAVWPRSLGGLDAHAGFASGWQDIEDWIDIARADIKQRPIVLVGHSQGGSIALIGFFEGLRKKWPVAECVTFGAPRTVSDNDLYKGGYSVTQYVHARDPIPSWLGATDYRHIRKVYIGGYESSPWWKKSFDYHGIDKYRRILSEQNTPSQKSEVE